MVDAAPVRSPWYFVTELLEEHNIGWRIEHGHRQVGWLVGMLTIALALATCFLEPRRWVKGLSVLALVAVSAQGVLGIFRIHLNERLVALLHGNFAQLVFALLATMMIVTGRRWALGSVDEAKLTVLRRWAVASALAVYCQLVFGGLVRHLDLTAGARLHLIGAFVVFAFVFVAIKFARDAGYASFRRPARLLMALLTVQVLFGVEAWFAWMKRFFRPDLAGSESVAVQLVRSGHYLIGALIFAATVALTVKAIWAPRAEEAAL